MKDIKDYTSHELYDLANEKAKLEKLNKETEAITIIQKGCDLLDNTTYLMEVRGDNNVSVYKFNKKAKAKIVDKKWFAREFEEEISVVNNIEDRFISNTVITRTLPETFRNEASFHPDKYDTLSVIDEETFNKMKNAYVSYSVGLNNILRSIL